MLYHSRYISIPITIELP